MTEEWNKCKIINPAFSCRNCKATGKEGKNISYQEWESSCGGYDDICYRCNDCDHHWWVEGSDS